MARLRSLQLAVLCVAVAGCQSMPWTRSSAVSDVAHSHASTAPGLAGAGAANATFEQAASYESQSNIAGLAGDELESDSSVLAELQIIGAVDPVAAQQLVTKLQDVKPLLRPLVARQFRTSWQYHRELTGAAGAAMMAGEQHPEPVAHVASLPAEYQPPTTATVPTFDTSQQAPVAPPAAAPTAPPPADAEQPTAPAGAPQAAATPADRREGDVVPASYNASPKLMPIADEQAATASTEPTNAEGGTEAPSGDDQESDTSIEVETPRDWQDALGQTIEQLTTTSPDDPRNTDEAYQHVRLRLLHLVAGEKEKALEPIPGLTPTEQTYWSNQLFAIATLLEYDAQPDDEQRASLAASQLAEASAKLGELSNLAIRSMMFCEKVYGYGDYEKLADGTFKPGQSVTLYAEIANFRSESTEKGYHTSLATSYEVLDQAGNRVEGGEFANVEDYCINKRQDFYIEYTFQLPSRIYASKYQLRLLIRDRLSGKIGKSTVEFEIKE